MTAMAPSHDQSMATTTGAPLTALKERLRRLISRPAVARSINSSAGFALGSLQGPHRKENQDRVVVAEISYPVALRGPLRIAIVCDGLGGLEEGGVAATVAISTCLTELISERGSSLPLPQALERAIFEANREVYEELFGRGGTTLTAVAMNGDGVAVVAHVGDSRVYQISADRSLVLLSKDDTLQGVLREHGNRIDEDELDNRLLQFVGIGEDLSPHISLIPSFRGQTFIVTSDGMHGLGRKILEGVAQNSASLLDLVRKACFVADAVGVFDNASIAALSGDSVGRDSNDNHFAVRVWTPLEQLELWISDSFPSEAPPGYSTKGPKPAASKPVKAAPKKARGKGGSRKGRKDVPPESSKNDAIANPRDKTPQLDIKFGNRD